MNQRGQSPASSIIALSIIFVLGVVTVISAVTVFQLPSPVTEQAGRTNVLYQPVLIISFIIFWGVTSGIIWAMFRYRRRSEDEDLPDQIHGSSVLEATWTIIPIIILVALFIPSLLLVIDFKTPPSDDEVDVRVEAIGHMWWWEFNYPEDGIRVQDTPPNYQNIDPIPTLVLPVDSVILIDVLSRDVVHSFSAPNTLYKIQAIPGNIHQMHVRFEETGVFWGQCYQFCGLRHSDMIFQIDVREQDEYEAWVAETQAAQGVSTQELATTAKD